MSEVVQPVGFPERWRTAPLWTLFRRTSRKGHSAEPLLSVYRDFGVVPRGFTDDNWNRIPEDLSGYPLVRPGDLVLNKMKAWQGSLGVSTYRGIVSPAYFVFAPLRDDFSQSFLHYLLRSRPFIESYGRMSGGIRVDQWDLDPWAFSRLRLPLPPLTEQRAIADYLDRETAKIDTLIEKQTAMIERLRERRAGVVSSAVVAGIQGETLAPTGDDWFPELNQRWKMRRLHYGFDVRLGKMLDGAKWTEVDAQFAPYLRAANVQPGGLDLSDIKEMPFTVGELARLDLRADDLLVVEGGSVGVAYRISEDLPGWSFQKTLNRVRTRRAESTRYLAYAFLHLRSAGVFELVASGSTFTHLTAEKLRAVRFPVPPLDEQREIADYLDRETAKIDTLIAKVERHIELAKERRAALITAAVTGQIDVTKDAE